MEGISDLGQSLLGGGLLDSVSRFVGAGGDATRRTFAAALPTSMYAIADHGSTEVGARGLIEGLRSGQAPQLDVKDLPSTLSDPQASDRLVTSSGGFLEHIMGGKLGGMLAGLSSYGGVGRSGASKLMALAAPLALGVIGKRVRTDNLDSKGLAGFLRDQKSRVATQVPGPLRSMLGLSSPMPERVPAPIRTQTETVRRDVAAPTVVRPSAGEPVKHSWWPWILGGLVALVGIGWLVSRAGRSARRTTVAAPVTTPAPTPAPAAKPPAPLPAAPLPEPVLSSSSVSMKQIGSFLAAPGTGQRRFDLDGLTFSQDEAGLAPEGQKVGDDLAALLKAHPKAKITLRGFSDSAGDPASNQGLSLARVEVVKRYLVDRGVSADRITTVGSGEEQPVAPNDTTAGRAQNPRVEVMVDKG